MKDFATIILACFLLPVTVYFCVKLGTYAYLRASYLFHKKHGENYGTSSTTTKEE